MSDASPIQSGRADHPGDNAGAVDLPPDFLPLRLVLYPNGGVVELKKSDMVMGRHSGADLRLLLPDVSRRHCRFLFSDGHWQALDLGSTNGIYLNGHRVEEATLSQGDLLRVGSYCFQVDFQLEPINHDTGTHALPPSIRSTDPVAPLQMSRADEHRRAS